MSILWAVVAVGFPVHGEYGWVDIYPHASAPAPENYFLGSIGSGTGVPSGTGVRSTFRHIDTST